jgi:hypothetical protein
VESAVGFAKADRKKERLWWGGIQKLDRAGCHVYDVIALDREHAVIAYGLRFARDVLHPDQRGRESGRPQGVHKVLAIIMQRKAAVGQAEHAAAVGRLSGE